MSLLDEAMEDCVMMDRRTESDGYGGYSEIWMEGAPFQAAIVLDSSMQARIASKQGVTSLYTVTTGKNLTLKHYDVFKRVSDGVTFRVTSNGNDNRTPASAALNMRQVSAEEWELTNG